ncbi:MAG: hypothetical protein P1V51_25285 [Deltaproteobacteria bacterium]|nr:hypothetical protein [Deltaproteobacteria bacterium]
MKRTRELKIAAGLLRVCWDVLGLQEGDRPRAEVQDLLDKLLFSERDLWGSLTAGVVSREETAKAITAHLATYLEDSVRPQVEVPAQTWDALAIDLEREIEKTSQVD